MFFVVLCCTANLYGQQSTKVSGLIKDGSTKNPIPTAILQIEGDWREFQTNADGSFLIELQSKGSRLLQISAPDYLVLRLEIVLDGKPLELGELFLEKNITTEKTDNLITLTDNELSDDEDVLMGSMGLLQSTRDVFLSRAAFDFGQAFFRVRGYDSENGTVLINGIPMNKFWDGRPQWNNWGGLNDVIRNQEFTNGLNPNPYTFGGILGNTNIDTRPSGFRPGLRVSSSMSNRTYRGRLMATYSSASQKKGLFYSISSSRRWAKTGYVDGTLYDAYSFFGALEYKFSPQNSVMLSGVMAKNRRGRSAALTEEVFELKGHTYNPYWGSQDGETRNSRERTISEPFFMLNHFMKSKKLSWTTGIAYQKGYNAKSRLGYYNSANPDPTYYKYVPGYQANSSIGVDFNNMSLAEEGFLNNAQIDWNQLYLANSNSSSASYLLSEDLVEETRLMLSTNLGFQLHDDIKLAIGANLGNSTTSHWAEISDLLGADFHEDVDSFSNTRNDLSGSPTKMEGDKIGYHFEMGAKQLVGFGQLELRKSNWNGFIAGSISSLAVQRNGLFLNERYPEDSEGKSEKLNLSGAGVKSGLSYFITGRHHLSANAALIYRPPSLQHVFINPREHNHLVPELQNEKISTVDVSYSIRLPDVTGRVSTFYTRFQNTTDVNFFFADTGFGSDFVQEVVTGMDKLHKGIELGLEYQVSNDVKLTVAGNLANYSYASDPNIELYFDTAGSAEDLINSEGVADMGVAKIKDLRVAQGPQTAFALGLEYRSPKYWWMGATTNYLDHSYANTSTIARTQSFYLDPDTKQHFPGATKAHVAQILKQQSLGEIYLLNLIGGKSWLVDQKYVSVFLSVNNLFDSVFKTGGYEQSRNATYKQMQQDQLSGTPSFGPKHWYGYGRTYFLNLAMSF